MTKDHLWKTVEEELRVALTDGEFASFIHPVSLADITDQDNHTVATLATKGIWHRQMIEKRFSQHLKTAFEHATGKPTELRFATLAAIPAGSDPLSASLGPLFSHATEERRAYAQAVQDTGLRLDFVFEQFAVSSTNEMAYAAAQAVSKNPGKMYRLLFLFGGVGVGKTHLMQAIGHRILEHDSSARIIYCSGEEFTNEIIEAIQFRSTSEFRKKYRQTNALLIDDIQFIGGKDRVQEEFFHTFNAVHRSGGQIVLTSDQLPNQIAGLEDRLRSRFEGGLTIDIQAPSFELRTAILLIKAKNLDLKLPMDIAQLIAANIESTRGLEGFLTRLTVESSARRMPITVELTEQLLGSTRNEEEIGALPLNASSPEEVLRAVAKVFSVKESVLKGKKRNQDIVLPRHLIMYLLRTDLGTPLEEAGALLGGRDHTTVMHAVDKITAQLPADERLRGAVSEIRKALKKSTVGKR